MSYQKKRRCRRPAPYERKEQRKESEQPDTAEKMECRSHFAELAAECKGRILLLDSSRMCCTAYLIEAGIDPKRLEVVNNDQAIYDEQVAISVLCGWNIGIHRCCQIEDLIDEKPLCGDDVLWYDQNSNKIGSRFDASIRSIGHANFMITFSTRFAGGVAAVTLGLSRKLPNHYMARYYGYTTSTNMVCVTFRSGAATNVRPIWWVGKKQYRSGRWYLRPHMTNIWIRVSKKRADEFNVNRIHTKKFRDQTQKYGHWFY